MVAVTITEEDNGKTIDAHVGDALVLRLREPATAGYRWSFDRLEASALHVQEDDGPPPAGPPGAARHAVWTLTPEKPGTWPVALKLGRRWEGEVKAHTRFEITLVVAAVPAPR
jgi:predicted secreted protein